MLLKISKTLSLVTIVGLLSSSLVASEILSQEQLEVLKLSKQKAKKENDKLKIDWVNPVKYTYTYSDDEKMGLSKKSILSINQPIFKSGGIYSAIKYASNVKESTTISLELQKKELIKKALNIAFNIKKLDIQIKKQNLQIANAIIDLKIKKESVFNGLLDISFLNNALITKNSKQSTLLDLQFNKKSLINSFNNLSSLPYQDIILPTLSNITEQEFNKNNIYLKKSNADIKSKKNLQWMVTSTYLPIVTANYSHTKNHSLDTTNDIYGFNIVVPLDIKSFDDSGASKLEYLKAKKELEIEKKQEINFLKTQQLKLEMIEQKVSLTKENIIAYIELLEQTKELADAGMKTSDDVKVLENSKNTEKLNLKIYDIDTQIELLDIYGRIVNDKI